MVEQVHDRHASVGEQNGLLPLVVAQLTRFCQELNGAEPFGLRQIDVFDEAVQVTDQRSMI
jgi:hypothetical protein